MPARAFTVTGTGSRLRSARRALNPAHSLLPLLAFPVGAGAGCALAGTIARRLKPSQISHWHLFWSATAAIAASRPSAWIHVPQVILPSPSRRYTRYSVMISPAWLAPWRDVLFRGCLATADKSCLNNSLALLALASAFNCLAQPFLSCSQGLVRRIDTNYLRTLALETIEEAAAASHLGPVPRTRGLALALAWLRHAATDDVLPLWPFKSFWEALNTRRTHDRWSAVNAAANAIYLAVGVERPLAAISAFECRSRASS